MEPLSKDRSRRLAQLMFEVLALSDFERPNKDEGEVAFTGRVLCDAVRSKLKDLGLDVRLRLKGDGTGEKSLPASFLGQDFHPDLSISRGSQNLWAAEIKILRDSNRQNSIATSFGQASLYQSRYEHVAVVFIDKKPGFVDSAHVEEMSRQVSIPIVVRKVSGKILLPFGEVSSRRKSQIDTRKVN